MPEVTNNMVEKSLIFAVKSHMGQKRKGNGLPYIVHPIGLASILLEVKESKNMNMLLCATDKTFWTESESFRSFSHRAHVLMLAVARLVATHLEWNQTEDSSNAEITVP